MSAGLDRFTEAQGPVIGTVMAELARGRKETHWMWFVFPQLAGLGRSERARFFGIANLDEAHAYAAHGVLGPRLRAAGNLMLSHAGRSAEEILGPVDALKLRSCATLFALEAPQKPLWPAVLDVFFDGTRCEPTERALGA